MVYLYFQGDEISIGPRYREGCTRMAVAPGTIWMIRLGASGDDCRYEFLDGFAVDGVVSDLIQEWAELPRCRPHKNWCREDVEWQSILNTTFPLHLAHTHPEHTGRPSGGSGGRKLEILDRWIAGSLVAMSAFQFSRFSARIGRTENLAPIRRTRRFPLRFNT